MSVFFILLCHFTISRKPSTNLLIATKFPNNPREFSDIINRMADVLLKRTLDEIGLQRLVTRFEEERIDGNDVLTLRDGKKNLACVFFSQKTCK